jgi:hypothetical protein
MIGKWLNGRVTMSRIWMIFMLWIPVNAWASTWFGPGVTGAMLLAVIVLACIAWAWRYDHSKETT